MKQYRFRILFGLALALLLIVFIAGRGEEKSAPSSQTPAAARESAGEPAAITGVNIADGEVLKREKPILVTFAEAMVRADAVDKPVAEKDMPFVLKPAVPGEGRWLTDKAFAFVVEQDFVPGREYSLYFRDDLQALDGRPARYVFSFKTEQTRILHIFPGAYNAAAFKHVLHLDFSQPVSREALAEHLAVTDAGSGEALGLDFSQSADEGSTQTVVLQLGKYRPVLNMVLRADTNDDKNPIGMAADYRSELRLPGEDGKGRTRVMSPDEPSPVKFYTPYGSEFSNGEIYARFYLTESLGSFSQKEFIRVTPDVPYNLNDDGDMLLFREKLEPGMAVTVTLLPGLADAAGRTLKEERSVSLTIRDREPAVRFVDPGSFLSPLFGSRVGLTLVNVDEVNVMLRRQYENNLPFMTLDPGYQVKGMMRNLSAETIEVKGGKRNEVRRRALDIESLAKGRRGVFLLTVQGVYTRTDNESGAAWLAPGVSQDRLVVLTDIGVTARVFPSGITVFASSLSTAEPLADAVVKVYSGSNQLIARGFTGPDGIFLHKRPELWEEQLTPSVITVQTGEGESADLTFLPLNYETGIQQPDAAMRPYLDKGYEAFVYTPRGVFRPGETVHVKAFVRGPEHTPPAPFPILFRIHSPRGLEAARGAATLSAEGGADFSFTLPSSLSTGSYRASVEIPGKAKVVLGFCDFSVEDFVPPRLEVEITPEVSILAQDAPMPVDLAGRYLFGVPGADLAYELGYRAEPGVFAPEGWGGYVFGDAEHKFDRQTNLQYMTGKLTDDGRKTLAFRVPADWSEAAGVLNVLLVGAVQEDGGRWVSRTAPLTWFPAPYMLGLKPEGKDFAPNAPVEIQIAAVDPQGKSAECGKLGAEIFLIQGNWHTVFRNGRYVYTFDERLIPQESRDVESADGKASLSFTPGQYGRYLVRVKAADGPAVSSCRVNVPAPDGRQGDDGTGRADAVELSFGKPAYAIGETAKLSVKAPYAGTLLLGLERGEQLSVRVLSLKQPATVLDIPVTVEMDPNITVTAWVIRPVREENREWFAHRAHGRATLGLSKTPHTLQVSASAPKRALPSATLPVAFTVTDEQGAPVEGEFSVAFVDEGILSLTGFRTPDPVEYFLARRRAVGKSHDAFDALLRPEAKATPLLTPGGGAGGAAYHGSLGTQPIFLALYEGTVRTDANGQGAVSFDLPEYSGKGRLMVVGASGSRFASAQTNVECARDLVVEASAPQAVAPGDEFEVSLKLFTLTTQSGTPLEGEASISIEAEGPLHLSGETARKLPLTPEKKDGEGGNAPVSHDFSVRAKAQSASGLARVRVSVSVPGRDDLSFSKEVQVAVRPPYPRTAVSASALVKAGESAELALPGRWLKGSAAPALSIDRSPALAVVPALEYLREYPYGCLEQRISCAWPYLALPALQEAMYPGRGDGGNNASAVLADAVSKISAMQVFGGGFAAWPGFGRPDPWRSVYAAFLLVEAKDRVPIAPSALANALAYARFILSAPAKSLGGEKYAYSAKAFAALVLTRAGEAPLGWMQHLSEMEAKMPPSGRIFLAGAKALKAGNTSALKELEGLSLSEDEKDSLNRTMESALRNKSLLLWLWSEVAPSEPRCLELCLDIAALLNQSTWYTTQEAGLASLAVGNYLARTGASGGVWKAEASSADKTLGGAANDAPLLLSAEALPKPGEDGAFAPVRVAVEGEGSAYVVYSARGVPLDAPRPASNGLVISRVWQDAKGNIIDLSSDAVHLKKGDRITVELTVATDRPVADIALSDLIPGGLEVENSRLGPPLLVAPEPAARNAANTGDRRAEEDSDAEEDRDRGRGFYLDLREDRLLVFFTRLKGKAVYRYTMRAVSRGTFALPPVAADAMYNPAMNAISSSGTLVVE